MMMTEHSKDDTSLGRLVEVHVKHLAEASELLSQLESRLSPVLIPEDVGVPGQALMAQAASPQRPVSPLADQINNLSVQVNTLCNRIRDISQRVEL